MKKIVLLFTICFITTSLFAQRFGLDPGRQPVKFGFKAGLSVSNMNFNKSYKALTQSVEASWKTGYVVGGLIEAPVYYGFSIQPEYMYYKTTGENKSNGNQYSTSYVSLPLLFKYSIIDRLSVLAGPQFDLLIKSVQNVNGIRKDITHETEERSIYVVGGVEFNFTESLSIDARYLHGFNHIGIRQPLDVTEFKYEGIQLTAAYKF